MRQKAYQVSGQKDRRNIAEYLSKDGQLLLALLELVCNTENAIDEVINMVGTAAVEAVLMLSAQEVAGPKHPGKSGGAVGWHGRQSGVVCLSDRKMRVEKPRLRRKGKGAGKEIDIPAYEAMVINSHLGQRMLTILMNGVSTRKYQEIIPEMAETVGVSKSQVSREFVVASAAELEHLCERRFDDVNILVIYLDGIQFGDCHVIAALGVDSAGHKHVLGIREGSSENARVATDLLTDLVARGVKNDQLRLFVIDGSKALRCAIDSVFGHKNPVQRCRNHKIRNVLSYVPQDQHEQIQASMKASFSLDAKDGKQKLEKLAQWLDREQTAARASLREGLDEMFTINRLGLPQELRRGLGSTNVIESPNGGIRRCTRRVKRWKDPSMVVRWVAASLLTIEKRFRRIMGYQQLWMLEAKLNELAQKAGIAKDQEVA
jgi:putative transposase